MKFNEMPYERPDFDDLLVKSRELLSKIENAATVSDVFTAIDAMNKLESYLSTQGTLCSIRNSIDTRDPFYEGESNVFDENSPRFEEITTRFAELLLASPFRGELEARYGKHLFEKLKLQIDIFKPEIIEDLVAENKLTTDYQKLMASAQIDFDGKICNLSELSVYLENEDRSQRKKANDALWGWIAEQSETLDRMFDDLVKIRDRIAKKLGFPNFIPVAYAKMGRTDWNQEDAKRYRDQIAKSVVPLASKLYREQAKRIGIDNPKNYDLSFNFLSGNPKPCGNEQELVALAGKMYDELSPETSVFFQTMRDQELMDLSAKPGKANGGYMTTLPDYQVPFIFSNFNGTSDDVDVLTHEAGHAFQGYLQKDELFSALKAMTMEVAEIHSMSMEFFTHPWMERFFQKDCEKYFYQHVVDALCFLAYGASIDEFQEWVYENPDASPDERNARYHLIELKYLPHLDYDGFPYLEGGARWQKQLHIYHYPFYYLDYTLAQVVALQFFLLDAKDHDTAWQAYLLACRQAGYQPFKALVKACGLKDPFEQGTLQALIPELEAYLDSLDKSLIL